ncbi:HD-GYP domain-containing protein [Porticoccus sp.]|uniref:HD-GYP domain-containing protein n=1 Tax=Porticoccus sp. TaxID=2024853 RepID=UPI003F69E42D
MSNQFLDRSNFIRVPVSGLKLGMLVTELDRPWLETPFLLQGFVIRHPSEIRKLQEYCDYVFVEKEGRRWGDKKDPFRADFGLSKRNLDGSGGSGLQKRVRAEEQKPSPIDTMHTRPEHPVEISVEEEHPSARRAYESAHSQVSNLLEQARLGNALDTEGARETVSHCVDSILRNPSALMWMAKIKHMDYYTMEHCLNVCILAVAFGRHLRLPKDELVKLGVGGMLHDVGKMRIPEQILNKPGKLSKEEFEVMATHPEEGRKLLMKSQGSLSSAIDVAINHHERMGGKGYPRGLFAHELSTYARIIAIVDAFDAMTSDRCYDMARSTLDSLKEIYRYRGTHFDEDLALEFIQLMGPYPPGTIVELSNGYVGIVLSSQSKKRHLPNVKLVLDSDKKPIAEEFVNLLDVERGTVPREWLIHRVLKDGEYGVFLKDCPVKTAVAGIASTTPESEEEPRGD